MKRKCSLKIRKDTAMLTRAKLLAWLGFLHVGLAFFSVLHIDADSTERKVCVCFVCSVIQG